VTVSVNVSDKIKLRPEPGQRVQSTVISGASLMTDD
jgi:hypothetical protein